MYITILTLFPDMFRGPFDSSIIARAQKKGLVHIEYVDIRDFAKDKHKSVDDHPYGGGTGMVLRVDVVSAALDYAKRLHHGIPSRSILMDPQGERAVQKTIKNMSNEKHLIIVCAHYEGVDERIRSLVDEEISIGDYILTCGELPAMVLVDAIVRLIPHVLKRADATTDESFENRLLEYPHYTKPPEFHGKRVPTVLLSGNHQRIAAWRIKESEVRTKKRRPDLLTG